MGFIHVSNVCHKEVITFSRLMEEEEARLIIREEKMGATEDQTLTIQRRSLKAMRNMKDSTLEEPPIHIRIWIRNVVMEDDEAEGSRRSLPMKQIKISIQLSFHDSVWLCICF